MTSFSIDPQAIEAMVVKSLVESFSPEQREKVISDAIANLLEKKSGKPFGSDTSLFEDAMNLAISQVARQVFVEEVKNSSEVQERIKQLVTPTVIAIAKDNYDGINEKIGEGIGDAVADWLRSQKWE